jgi:5-formyltetrahydrofolate cyclo-ligase
MKNKDKVRKDILRKRDSLSKEEILEKSQRIKNILFSQKEYKQAKLIMFYLTFKSEVDTSLMIKDTFSLGKKVAVPIIEDKTIIPVELKEKTPLIRGKYGILEPKHKEEINPDDIDLVIVPGVAFDIEGRRLGYGGGYYDRFLSSLNKSFTIGLCFELQLVHRLPQQAHDIKVKEIITENRCIISSS